METVPEKLQSSDAWRRIEDEFLATGRAAGVLSGLTEATDAIVRQAYGASIQPVCPESAEMLAVGAYGRREIFPYSAADLVILLERNAQSEPVKGALARFARLLWDAGLRLNYTARTLAECLDTREQNLELIVNLLDRRFLAGDRALDARLEARLPVVLLKHAREIRQHISHSARTRHAKYQNTCHHLEPDVKEAPGGLGDLSLIDWLAKLNPEYRSSSEKLKPSGELPSSARSFLHYQAGQDQNVLHFDAQHSLAQQAFVSSKKPAEWMREYLRNARMIFNEARRALDASERTHNSLLENFREYRTRLSNGEFTVSRDRVLLRNPAQLDTDPAIVFRLLEFVARHGIQMAHETERRLETAYALFAEYCAQPQPLWSELKSILRCPHAALALRALENTGLLTALFPEWTDIQDLPVADPEHRYTADEHTLSSIECVAGLPALTDPTRQRFSELLSEIDNPALLLFALLFHETGSGGSDPLGIAAKHARAAMARIQMHAEDRSTVEFLIEHQHDLATAMTGRDLDDPAAARALADRVGTVELLKLLSVFTYADISAANSEALTPWRLEQLSRAYSAINHELTRELETDRIQQVPGNLPESARFIKGFPVRYLRARTPGEIEAHLRLFELSRPTGVAVQLDEIEAAHRLTIVARDRPSLFASFAGAITSFGMDILKAEAFSNVNGLVLDTFVFADPKRMLQLNPSEVERLQDLVQRVALGKTDAQRLMRNVSQPGSRKRAHSPQVQFDSEACATATLVEIVADDRPGLLYSLAMVFSSSACNIDTVLIDTKGHRAIDVFYVARDGRKLSAELQTMLKEKLISVC